MSQVGNVEANAVNEELNDCWWWLRRLGECAASGCCQIELIDVNLSTKGL